MNSNQIKFNKHNVSNGAIKARVRYSLDNHVNGKPCVWINAKDYDAGDSLALIIPNGYSNNTDSRQDVFEKGKVILFENHPLYASARAFVSMLTRRASINRNLGEKHDSRGRYKIWQSVLRALVRNTPQVRGHKVREDKIPRSCRVPITLDDHTTAK